MNKETGCVTVIVLLIITVFAFFGFFNKYVFGNKQIIDLKQNFNVAYIQMTDGTSKKIYLKKWNDYENSDSIQIIGVDGTVYYTHLNRVILSSESK